MTLLQISYLLQFLRWCNVLLYGHVIKFLTSRYRKVNVIDYSLVVLTVTEICERSLARNDEQLYAEK